MKNKVIDIINQRRSTRNYKPEEIAHEEIETIVNAGLMAPSAHNQQSWHFTVITDRSILSQMSKDAKEESRDFDDETIRRMANNENFDIFYKAPAAIIVSGENSSMMPHVDCAAATQNMLLAAESLGLGSCWNGFVHFLFNGSKKEKWIKDLRIPDNHTPYYAVGLGYKNGNEAKAPARREGRVNYIDQ